MNQRISPKATSPGTRRRNTNWLAAHVHALFLCQIDYARPRNTTRPETSDRD